jgi:hypothetical protein
MERLLDDGAATTVRRRCDDGATTVAGDLAGSDAAGIYSALRSGVPPLGRRVNGSGVR